MTDRPSKPLLDSLEGELQRLERPEAPPDDASASVWRELDELMTSGEPDATGPPTIVEHRRLRAFEQRMAEESAVSTPTGPRSTRHPRSRRSSQILSLAAALLIGVLAMGWWQAHDRARWAEQHLLESTRAAALVGLEHESAGTRLQAVALTQRAMPPRTAAPDDAILAALLRAAGEDPSDNVRLAAIEALAAWSDRPDVAGALIDTVPGQSSPTVLWRVATSTLPHSDPVQRRHLRGLIEDQEDRLGPEITSELTSLIDQAIPEI